MKATGIVRNVDELGRIVIPKEMRKKMDIHPNDPIEIYVEDEKIILAKYVPHCVLCGSDENVVEFKTKRLCTECIRELKNC